jgi:hypothetical protein
MFCNSCGVSVAADAPSCPNCGHGMFPQVSTPTAAGQSQLPYGWRFFAGLQLAVGSFLAIWLILFHRQLYPSIRHLMVIGVGIALPLGYGLWQRAKWSLYMLTVVFSLEAGIWVAGFRHGAFKPTLTFYIHAVMVYYYWKYRACFVLGSR